MILPCCPRYARANNFMDAAKLSRAVAFSRIGAARVTADPSLIDKYGLFIWEVVKAHVATTPKNPRTLHYRGRGQFMVAGGQISRREKFKPQNL